MLLININRKAKVLGAVNSSFRNFHGLPISGHLSTAYDLALLSRYGMAIPEFVSIVNKSVYVLSGPSGRRWIKNTNKLLKKYPEVDGIKTGTTVSAGKCLATSAVRGEDRLIAVVLHSDNRFQEAMVLLQYGFGMRNEPVDRK